MGTGGFVKIHRKVLNNPVLDDPWYQGAWVALLLLAGYDKHEALPKNNKPHLHPPVHIKPGQLAVSQRWLADEWNTDRNRVRRFLKRLEEAGMIVTRNPTRKVTRKPTHQTTQEKTHLYTIITICNWGRYQHTPSNGDPPFDPPKDPQLDPQGDPQLDPQLPASGSKQKAPEPHKKRKEVKEVIDPDPLLSDVREDLNLDGVDARPEPGVDPLDAWVDKAVAAAENNRRNREDVEERRAELHGLLREMAVWRMIPDIPRITPRQLWSYINLWDEWDGDAMKIRDSVHGFLKDEWRAKHKHMLHRLFEDIDRAEEWAQKGHLEWTADDDKTMALRRRKWAKRYDKEGK